MQKDFVSLQIDHIKAILAEPKSISKGIWYAPDYFKVCPSLEKFISSGATFHGYASEEFFSYVKDDTSPTGCRLYSFQVKINQRPSLAIFSLQKGISLLDCGSVCYLACYLALLDVLGEEKFDDLFHPEGPFPLLLTGDEASTISLLMPKRTIKSEKEIRPGDICYFCNCQEYTVKHPAGESRGFNVLCCSDAPAAYLGFGMRPEGLEREKVEYNLWECFNEDPVDQRFYSPAVWKNLYSKTLLCDEAKSKQLVDSFKEKKMSWEEYQNNPGRLAPRNLPTDGKLALWVYRPNASLINELQEAPLSRGRQLLAGVLRN